jgi:hypothetical protein
MDAVLVSALAGVAVRGIAAAEQLARLRWQERQRCADRSFLQELARSLPAGYRAELRADGSGLVLAAACPAEPAERLST